MSTIDLIVINREYKIFNILISIKHKNAYQLVNCNKLEIILAFYSSYIDTVPVER